VATFELEGRMHSMDKHGAGAILTLAARSGIGVLVSEDNSGEAVLRAYQPIVGAGNVVAVSADKVRAL
jgi:hypothetical protein